jgi:carbonic anhydrase/acetyltransferase-like protein (isoleucine patch superfamily)
MAHHPQIKMEFLRTTGKIVPPCCLTVGVPAQVIRRLTDEDVAMSAGTALRSAQRATEHIVEAGGVTDGPDRE